MMEEWTTSWPQEEGWYWFYGDAHHIGRKELYAVQTWKIKNGFTYVANGNFIYAQEAVGVWLPMIVPELMAS